VVEFCRNGIFQSCDHLGDRKDGERKMAHVLEGRPGFWVTPSGGGWAVRLEAREATKFSN
jgi:hypothetical protein